MEKTTIEIDRVKLRELIDHTYKLEMDMRDALLGNFYELSKHHSEISKIRDFLVGTEVQLNVLDSKT